MLGRRRRIQGVTVDIDDLMLRGVRFRTEITDAVLSAEVVRSMEGASSLSVSVQDDDHELVNSKLLEAKFDLTLDRLGFRYRGADDDGEGGLAMKFESREVARLRAQTGHVKALRNKATRAEFALMLVRELKRNPIPFFSPALHVVQPIKTKREAKEVRDTKDEQRAPGLGPNARITVKGVRADASQIAIADEILDVCMSLNCSFRVMSMAIACATQESNMVDLGSGDYAHPDSRGPFGQWNVPYPNNGTIVGATRGFLLGTPAGDHFGIIEYDKQNPDANFSLAIAAVQRCREDLVMEYQQWKDEANATVEAYLGGATAGEGGSVEITREIPYAFERKKNENSWTCLTRLADEVNWRCFESAGMIYFVDDTYLLRSRIRMRVNDDSDGIDKIAANYVGTKKVHEATISGRARSWAAPPGTVVVIEGRGRADGRYLVKEIRSGLFNDDFEATLIRPGRPLPEPPAQTKTISRDRPSRGGRGSSGTGDADKMVKWAISNVGVTEGSAKHRKWASDIGNSVGDPWCAIFIAYGLKHVCGMELPATAAYTGDWLTWSGGRRVSPSNPEPGDLMIYDWGDGGRTDHIDLYIGDGECIGGNEGPGAVVRAPFDSSQVVGCVRPNYA